jgi:hypothetical protein
LWAVVPFLTFFFSASDLTNNVLHLGMQFTLVLNSQFVNMNEPFSSVLMRFKFETYDSTNAQALYKISVYLPFGEGEMCRSNIVLASHFETDLLKFKKVLIYM